MYRTIYVPVDNSEHSNRSVELAVELAKRSGAALIGSHVYAAKLHDYRFKQMEFTLPEEYLEENELERQRRIHDSLITMGLQLISDSYLEVMGKLCAESGVAFTPKMFDGKHYAVLADDIAASRYDLVVMGAMGLGAVKESLIGSVCERVIRRVSTDTLVVRNLAPLEEQLANGILVGIDGSPQSFAGLETALELGRMFSLPVEAVAVYDPYLHYTMFNSIVGVLNEQASKVFRFEEQEQLHEEIIDTGLAKIYQSHLEIAQEVARQRGDELRITLLDGKAFERIMAYVRQKPPWLLILGRYGVHRDGDGSELGSNTENLLRLAPCNLLLTARTFVPPIDIKAEESIAWTEEAQKRMVNVPPLAKGIAKTAVIRYAVEQGHSVITSKIIDAAMEMFMPMATARVMGMAAKALAAAKVEAQPAVRSICMVCGYAAKDASPQKCPVCSAGAEQFQHVDREVVQSIIEGEGGIQEEETFDGVKLKWTKEARDLIRSIEDAYQRRRTKARIEKRARTRKLPVIGVEFARPLVEDALVDSSLSTASPGAPSGTDGAAAATSPPSEDGEGFRWTDDALERLNRVPAGFMRDMARSRIEALAAQQGRAVVTLDVADEAIGQARQMMGSMIGAYSSESGRNTVRNAAPQASQSSAQDDQEAAEDNDEPPPQAPREITKLNEVTMMPYKTQKDGNT